MTSCGLYRNLERCYLRDKDELINDALFKGIEDQTDICSIQNLQIQTNVSNIQTEELGGDNDYNPFA